MSRESVWQECNPDALIEDTCIRRAKFNKNETIMPHLRIDRKAYRSIARLNDFR
jgi:hypothetical protein